MSIPDSGQGLSPSVISLWSQIVGMTGFQASNLWNFAFFSQEAFNGGNWYSKDGKPSDPSEFFTFLDSISMAALVQKVSIPFPSIDTEPTWANQHYVSDYKPVSEDVSMTFLENNIFTVWDFFQDWLDAIYDPTNFVVRRGNKKLDGILMFHAYPLSMLSGAGPVGDLVSNLPVPTAFVHYKGLLFKGLDGLSPDYDQSDVLNITAKFSCDSVRLHRLLG